MEKNIYWIYWIQWIWLIWLIWAWIRIMAVTCDSVVKLKDAGLLHEGLQVWIIFLITDCPLVIKLNDFSGDHLEKTEVAANGAIALQIINKTSVPICSDAAHFHKRQVIQNPYSISWLSGPAIKGSNLRPYNFSLNSQPSLRLFSLGNICCQNI